MPLPLAARVLAAACARHGLGPGDALRLLQAEVDLVQTPADLRRGLGLVRGPARTLAESLLLVMPRSGSESFLSYHVWFHAGDSRQGRDWFVSEASAPYLDAEILELQQLSRDLLATEDLHLRFERDHRRLERLAHPHVVPCRHHGIAPGHHPYRLVALREGPTLARLLERRGRLAAAEVLGIAIQAATGLDALHEARIAHRDLEAESLAVTPLGVVQVLDAGRAGDRPLSTPPEVLPLTPRMGLDWADQPVQGTRQWRKVDRRRLDLWLQPPHPPAPEVAAGGIPDQRTDIHDLGLVLRRALLGTEDVGTLDHGLERLLRACTEPDPDKRPTAAEVVAYAEGLRETLRLAPAATTTIR